MDALQNFTNPPKPTGDGPVPRPYSQLTNVQRAYIDYKAVGGLITTDDDDGPSYDSDGRRVPGGQMRSMTIQELADALGVSRQAIYEAKKYVPNFWDLVNERRKQLSSQSALQRVHKTLKLKAVKGEFQHLQLYLAYFDPDFPLNTNGKKDESVDSLAEAMNVARQRRLEAESKTDQAIEGEIVKDANNA